jgi:hypothetical protein
VIQAFLAFAHGLPRTFKFTVTLNFCGVLLGTAKDGRCKSTAMLPSLENHFSTPKLQEKISAREYLN